MKEKEIRKEILSLIERKGTPLLQKRILEEELPLQGKEKRQYKKLCFILEEEGTIFFDKGGYGLTKKFKDKEYKITKVTNGFGFAERGEEKYFIPGRFLKGALPGDVCILLPLKQKGDSPEGKVIAVVEPTTQLFTGQVVKGDYDYLVLDCMNQFQYPIQGEKEVSLNNGDQVAVKLKKRGTRHQDHTFQVVKNLGSKDKGDNCCKGILLGQNISATFPPEVEEEGKRFLTQGLTEKDLEGRMDLRKETIFTIDGAYSKDLDDALSITKTEEGYELGVHIADVSHYVTPRSRLDEESFSRGTSIYYGDQVVPMLPVSLSNGVCSLLPDVPRLAFSVFIPVTDRGEVGEGKFYKTIIQSKVKGVYQEVNQLLEGEETPEIKEKYREVEKDLRNLQNLWKKLWTNRQERGALNILSDESALVFDEERTPIEIVKRQSGVAEKIVEECMLLANSASAKLGKEKELPFLYRVHEPPTEKKIGELKELFRFLDISIQTLDKRPDLPKTFSDILEKIQGSPLAKVVNMQVLRTMSKAKYSHEIIGHFGLALEDYAHFTSPIRRYPDLLVHRILSGYLSGIPVEKLQKRYGNLVIQGGAQSTEREQKAADIERSCISCYKAEYMSYRIGNRYEGRISGLTNFGLYVELENSVEGLAKEEDCLEGKLHYTSPYYYSTEEGIKVSIGTKVLIQVLDTNISLGQIDFKLIDLLE